LLDRFEISYTFLKINVLFSYRNVEIIPPQSWKTKLTTDPAKPPVCRWGTTPLLYLCFVTTYSTNWNTTTCYALQSKTGHVNKNTISLYLPILSRG